MAADKDRNWAFAQNWAEQLREDMECVHLKTLSYHCEHRDEGVVRSILGYLKERRNGAYTNRKIHLYERLTR